MIAKCTFYNVVVKYISFVLMGRRGMSGMPRLRRLDARVADHRVGSFVAKRMPRLPRTRSVDGNGLGSILESCRVRQNG